MSMESLWTEPQLAKFLQMKLDTLRRIRYKHKGPSYILVGGTVRYRPEDIKAWLQKQTNVCMPARNLAWKKRQKNTAWATTRKNLMRANKSGRKRKRVG